MIPSYTIALECQPLFQRLIIRGRWGKFAFVARGLALSHFLRKFLIMYNMVQYTSSPSMVSFHGLFHGSGWCRGKAMNSGHGRDRLNSERSNCYAEIFF